MGEAKQLPVLSEASSKELAQHIVMIAHFVRLIDTEYAKLAAEQMLAECNKQESMSAIFAGFNPAKTELVVSQAKALLILVSYIEELRNVDALKQKVLGSERQMENIAKLFF